MSDGLDIPSFINFDSINNKIIADVKLKDLEFDSKNNLYLL
jgi:hypothetical protein